MAAFFAGLFALIAGVLFGTIAGMFIVGCEIVTSKTFRDFVRRLCDENETEESDVM